MASLHLHSLFFFFFFFFFLAFVQLHRPVSAIDALFNEPAQYLLAPANLGQFGFNLATNCSIWYRPKQASNSIPMHKGFPGVVGCQLVLDNNGTVGLFPNGEFERHKFLPRQTRSGYYVLAGVKGHTIVHGPAIFCTPKELCRTDLPHSTRPPVHSYGAGFDPMLSGTVISGPAKFKPGVIMSYADYTLLLEDDCNLRIVDVSTGLAKWSTSTVLPPVGVMECEMVLTHQGELILQVELADGKIQRLYGTGVIAGKHTDPGHLYALRYDGRFMIYPPKPWSRSLRAAAGYMVA